MSTKITRTGTEFIQCDRRGCTKNYIFDGSTADYDRVRDILIIHDWWFDYAGAFCPQHHREFNKGINPEWAGVFIPDLPGLTNEALNIIFKGKY